MEEFQPLSKFLQDVSVGNGVQCHATEAHRWGGIAIAGNECIETVATSTGTIIETATDNYLYSGECPETGAQVSLPRTPMAEAIAHALMHQLEQTPSLTSEGKMFGVLIVRAPDGTVGVLKAFSGILNGQNVVPGWVPPIPGREEVIVEEDRTVRRLDEIQDQLIRLVALPERQEHENHQQQYAQQWDAMSDRHRQRKRDRQRKRQQLQSQLEKQLLSSTEYEHAINKLDDESRLDGIEKRTFKRERDAKLAPLRHTINMGDRQIRELKQERKRLSRSLQAQMHEVYRLTNFRGSSSTLASLGLGGALPTGTGDCCAPKLLHYAATHHLYPVAMAEFWWGEPPPSGDKVHRQFYGACPERCQPIMGFLLSGLSVAVCQHAEAIQPLELPILFEDDWLIAVDKPPDLLSVPGRHSATQDSVENRLRLLPPEKIYLKAVHRLDRETSGILLLAKTPEAHADINQQFQRRSIQKVYGAVLAGIVSRDEGIIDVPLSPDFQHRPKQRVNADRGKPSQTVFRVLSRSGHTTAIEFIPLTGRTHQLRVHASAPEGLGIPILGDRLYGDGQEGDRLHLHASKLTLIHPIHRYPIHLTSPVPFFPSYSGVHMN
jgi:tRNA pseudouridine32 synthase/23S rRNA pseudouridine746 synthase